MSGGHFNYDQYKLGQMAGEIEFMLEHQTYQPETVELLKETVLRLGEIMAQRANWLFSGDDGEESYVKRLRDEVKIAWVDLKEK